MPSATPGEKRGCWWGGLARRGLPVGDPTARALTLEEQEEYMAAMGSDLRALLAGRTVPEEVIAGLSLAGYRRMETFVVMADNRDQVRSKMRDTFGYNFLTGTPEQQFAAAMVTAAWEATQVRGAAQAGADAEAPLRGCRG